MQIVIDISAEDFEKVKYGRGAVSMMRKAIQRGIPLPKGHGRLKDVDEIIRDGISKGFCEWYDEMKYAPTIIEADDAESEVGK